MPMLFPPAAAQPAPVAADRRPGRPARVENAHVRSAVSHAALPLPPSADPRLASVRRLVWFYLILWVLEGALRKWIVPGLANPLLIIRDPVLLGIYALALQRRVFPFQHPFVVVIGALGALCVAMAYLVTPASWVVITYGWRSNFLHLPLIFLLPLIFDESDVREVGRWLLLSALPMSLLVLIQFRSAPTAWVNTVVGGEGTQLESAYDHVRVAGTFSFTNGMCAYTALVAAFFFYQMLERKTFARWLWLSSGAALVIMVVLSGSRATVGVVLVVILGVAAVCVVRPAYWRASFKLFAVGGLVLLVLGSFTVFREGLNVFSYRFGDEESIHKGFFLRYFGSLMVSPIVWTVAPYGGIGLGMGTNVASSLLIGKRYFMAAEGEYDRLVLESGPVLGVMIILMRQSIVVWLGLNALKRLRASSRPLPVLLLCAGASSLLIGQWAQPTELGFSVIAGGLCLAAMRPAPEPAEEEADEVAVAPVTKPNANGVHRPSLAAPGRNGRAQPATPAARLPRGDRRPRRSLPNPRRHCRRRARLRWCAGDVPRMPSVCTAAGGTTSRTGTDAPAAGLSLPPSPVSQKPPPCRLLRASCWSGTIRPTVSKACCASASCCAANSSRAGCGSKRSRPPVVLTRKVAGATDGGLGKWLAYLDKYVLFPRQLRARVQAALAEEPETPLIVHVSDHSNAVYLSAVQAAFRTSSPAATAGARVVVTCHDLGAVRGAFGEAAQTFCPASRTGRILQRWIRHALGRADLIACVSAATEADVRRLVRARGGSSGPPPTRVVRTGQNFPFRPLPEAEAERRLAMYGAQGFDPTQPFLLNVGSSLPRKNREGVLRIFVRMLTQGWRGQLVFAGELLPPELAELARGITASGVGRVVQVFNPSGDALQALYSRALALVFPSRFEGFGWPLIEAQACGCPVACGDTPALAEVAGESAFVAPAEDADAFAAHLLTLAGDPAIRAEWVERGRQNLARFQTERMTDEYLAAYRDALAAPGSGGR